MSDLNLRFCQTNMSVYEEIVSNIIAAFPKGGVYVDLGAHVGQHTAAMVNRNDVRRVYAVEAIPQLCDELNIRFKECSKVKVICAAVGQRAGEATFSIAENALGYSGLKQRGIEAVSHWVDITVPVLRLDDVLESQDLNLVGLIKLDLEGGEFHAMMGSKDLLTLSKPLLVFENGLRDSARDYEYTGDDFFGFFDTIDYELIDFFGNTVDRPYWDAVLRTYMFIAYPRDSKFEKWCSSDLSELVHGVVKRKMYEQACG
jgi:FkbM family methyltransferase